MNIPDYLEPILQETLNLDNETARLNRTLSVAATLGAKLSKDGDTWCVLLGDNLQTGVAGFGCSPVAAYNAFEAAFYGTPSPTPDLTARIEAAAEEIWGQRACQRVTAQDFAAILTRHIQGGK